jgi:hypothetical protein
MHVYMTSTICYHLHSVYVICILPPLPVFVVAWWGGVGVSCVLPTLHGGLRIMHAIRTHQLAIDGTTGWHEWCMQAGVHALFIRVVVRYIRHAGDTACVQQQHGTTRRESTSGERATTAALPLCGVTSQPPVQQGFGAGDVVHSINTASCTTRYDKRATFCLTIIITHDNTARTVPSQQRLKSAG